MATKDKVSVSSKHTFKEKTPQYNFAFTKDNYIWMLIGLVVLALGYILLIGGGSKDPNVFNDSLFNTQRLVISPILIVAGLVIEVYAIMKRSKKNTETEQQ
ncbi:MAG: DUF3098 domain-containing protein [Bacteroidales bacterium]|nr:DUF3098 domain-containing protein [Bacteroidales bacterium]